ncbi:MAG: NfeD family protein [Candidatus Adiutrix sp.]|jgi:membrane protein implicated in regulation of membrane protease activity|nr:NfeD family protein [Candidatus Adiutrix sp.]
MLSFHLDPPLVWFLLGIGFLVLEACAPGLFLMFFGLGAWSAALAALAGLEFTAQMLTFMAVALASLVLLRDKLKKLLAVRAGRGEEMEDPVVADQYLGREVTVISEATPGRPALVELNGADWQARCEAETLRLGDRVRVVARENLTLVVTKISPPAA